MSDDVDLPNIPGFVSVKDAAKMLGLAERTVYEYIEEGRLSGFRAADVIMIPVEEVKNFKRGTSGRPRKNTPPWRISSGDNTQFMTLVTVQTREGRQDTLMQKLEEMRRRGQYIFPGTIVRSIVSSETNPGQAIILLIWRGTVMPDETKRAQELEAFQQALTDVVDWSTAQYNNGRVLMHG
jgi:excisionase family DNA binding protein